jgi:hypothetical protein
MSKKFKFASAVLSAGLLITPVSGLINNYDSVAKAEYNSNQKNQVNIENHIKYIDNQIYLENNNLKINKNNILNYIKKNWNELNINNKFNTPEECYNNIELSVNKLNKKVKSGWYKFNKDKSISQKYQDKYTYSSGLEEYEQWWGYQYYIKSQSAANEYKFLIKNLANKVHSLIGWIPGADWIISNQDRMAEAGVDCFNAYGSAKVSVYIYTPGYYYTVEPIQ